MTAPDEIWAFHTPDDFDDDATITAYETTQYGGTSYTRTDLVAAMVAAAYEDDRRADVHADAKAAMNRIVAEAVKAEREACAKVADGFLMVMTSLDVERGVDVVAAIRARGERE